ncbi:putative dual specificity protein phosphatase DSP8 [Olea europaea var. sylvestris]|uniref:phosphatidylglycerophosphatase n=1 Tax=Olea europaea subsp. europaea TaxID=158383 RepID=A0A8S0PV11_OLEEU|nr:putative dual specificity protein phosphatase DSP8 [Olea europaea var. sylvestris]CAA2955415.1 dual specificity phosphatase DSP8 [Olea europaea subsp. europaea]
MKIEQLDEPIDSSVDTNRSNNSDDDQERRLITVRVDAKRALVGAGARILFYPTLLYNVFRNKIQAEFRWWDQIDQFLLLGAVPFPKDVPRLKQLGVGGVITLNEPYETLVSTSLYHAHEIDHLVIPTRDYLFAPTFADINRAVDFIHENSCSGRTTYVHCKAGRGRSTTIVLCYLVEYKNMSPIAAFEYVRSRRPRILLAPSQWKAVQEYKKQRILSRLICPSGDAVIITKADLEGYPNPCNDDSGKELAIVPRMPKTRPMMARLSCLFASLKVTGGCGSVARQMTEARA